MANFFYAGVLQQMRMLLLMQEKMENSWRKYERDLIN